MHDAGRGPGRKSFNFFSSQLGRSVIISDDEDGPGLTTELHTLPRAKPSIREKLTNTLTRRKKKKEPVVDAMEQIIKPVPIPDILFVDKPHFSSESDLSNIVDLEEGGRSGRRSRSEPRRSSRDKHTAEIVVRVPSR